MQGIVGKLTGGVLMDNLKNSGIKEISRNGLVDWFLDTFRGWDSNFSVNEIKSFASKVGIRIVR